MGWRTYVSVGIFAILVALIFSMQLEEIPAPKWVRTSLTVFVAVYVLSLGILSYFQSVEARLRRSAAWLLIFSAVMLATKVLLGWTINAEVAGVFKFLMARGDPVSDVALLVTALIFSAEGLWLIWLGHKVEHPGDRDMTARNENSEYLTLEEYDSAIHHLVEQIRGSNHQTTGIMRHLVQIAFVQSASLGTEIRTFPNPRFAFGLFHDGLRHLSRRLNDFRDSYPEMSSLKQIESQLQGLARKMNVHL
jgi:hypothetical protein